MNETIISGSRSMEIRKCRILVCPEEDDKEAEFWYYEAPEAYAHIVGYGILYCEKWNREETRFDRVQSWDPKGRNWVDHGECFQSYKSPASQEEVDHHFRGWFRARLPDELDALEFDVKSAKAYADLCTDNLQKELESRGVEM